MRNIHKNEQSGLILPQVLDEKGEQYFKFELLGINGQKSYDVSEVIKRYDKAIITALMASQMILGQDGGGSFSLAESLTGISEMSVESKLLEIQEQLNHDLIPQLFELNGFDTEVTPYFQFGQVSKADIDAISKYLQRAGSIGLISDNPDTVNWVADQIGAPRPFDDTEIAIEEARKKLTGYSSGAAEGMQTAGEGTSKSPVGSDDSSVGNLENKASVRVRETDNGFIVQFGDKTTEFSKEDWKELVGD